MAPRGKKPAAKKGKERDSMSSSVRSISTASSSSSNDQYSSADQMNINNPIYNGIPQEIAKTFLPYLGLGFVPLPEQGTAVTCAYYALMFSFNAARQALRNAGDPQDSPQDTKIDQWKKWFAGTEYRNVVREYEFEIDQDDLKQPETDQERQEMQQWTAESQGLSAPQLAYLLEVANHEYGTRFQLGVIRQGYEGRRDSKTGVLDDTFIVPTTLEVQGENLRNGPVLWLYNSNLEARNDAHGIARDKKSADKWSGFGPLDLREKSRVEDSRRSLVKNWLVGSQVQADMEAPVYILLTDMDAIETNSDLDAYAKCFVRRAINQTDAPKGSLMVARANGNPALVPRENLQELVYSMKAPSFNTDETTRDSIQKSLKKDGTGRSSDKNLRNNNKQVTRSSSHIGSSRANNNTNPSEDQKVNQEEEAENKATDDNSGEEEDQVSRKTRKTSPSAHENGPIQLQRRDYKFFRVIPPSKLGREFSDSNIADLVSKPIDGFEVRTGEIVLLRSRRHRHQGMDTIRVRNVHGDEGFVWRRRVAAVSKPAFGLDPNLHILPNVRMTRTERLPAGLNKAELQEVATALGLPISDSGKEFKSALLKSSIEEDEKGPKKYIHVYELRKDLPVKGTTSQVSFEQGEWVIVNQGRNVPAQNNGKLNVRDFEGFEGSIPMTALKSVAPRGWQLRFRDENDAEHRHGIFGPGRSIPGSGENDLSSGDEAQDSSDDDDSDDESDDGMDADDDGTDEENEAPTSKGSQSSKNKKTKSSTNKGTKRGLEHSDDEEQDDAANPRKKQKPDNIESVSRGPSQEKKPIIKLKLNIKDGKLISNPPPQ